MKYLRITLILFLIGFLYFCTKEEVVKTPEVRVVDLAPEPQPAAPIDIKEVDKEIGSDAFTTNNLSEHYFGSFFNDNVSYYIIDSVQFPLMDKDYKGELVLCYIDEVLYKKTYTLSDLQLEDFLDAYKCRSQFDEQMIEDLKSKRFYSLKVNAHNMKVLLRKKDHNEYMIEESHEYLPVAWNKAMRNNI